MNECDSCGNECDVIVTLWDRGRAEMVELCATCLGIYAGQVIRYANIQQHLIEIGGDAMMQCTDGHDDWKDRRNLWWGGAGWPL